MFATPLPPVLQRTFLREAGVARWLRDAIPAKGRSGSPAANAAGFRCGARGHRSRRRGSPAGCGRRGGGSERLNNVATGSRGTRGRRAPERNPGCPRRKGPNTAAAGSISGTIPRPRALPARRSKTGCAEFPAPVFGGRSGFRHSLRGRRSLRRGPGDGLGAAFSARLCFQNGRIMLLPTKLASY